MLAHQEAHKELMERMQCHKKNLESSTEICGMKIKTCKNIEAGKQKSEENKEESGQMIRDMRQCEEYDRKDNNSGVSKNKSR